MIWFRLIKLNIVWISFQGTTWAEQLVLLIERDGDITKLEGKHVTQMVVFLEIIDENNTSVRLMNVAHEPSYAWRKTASATVAAFDAPCDGDMIRSKLHSANSTLNNWWMYGLTKFTCFIGASHTAFKIGTFRFAWTDTCDVHSRQCIKRTSTVAIHIVFVQI